MDKDPISKICFYCSTPFTVSELSTAMCIKSISLGERWICPNCAAEVFDRILGYKKNPMALGFDN